MTGAGATGIGFGLGSSISTLGLSIRAYKGSGVYMFWVYLKNQRPSEFALQSLGSHGKP